MLPGVVTAGGGVTTTFGVGLGGGAVFTEHALNAMTEIVAASTVFTLLVIEISSFLATFGPI
ncbi:MAG: hypothetical protein NVSMB18_02370 [Acetobacteraceae bacterium]